MRVYGYNNERRLVAVDLTEVEIAKFGIDPWRVDLFDPNPLVLSVGDKKINFRRLGNMCLAYRKGNQFEIAVHDGVEWSGFASEKFKLDAGGWKITTELLDLKPVHFEYSRYLSEHNQMLEEGIPRQFGANAMFSPAPLSSLRLNGNKAVFTDNSMAIWRLLWEGEMFREQTYTLAFPRQIDWVLNEFASAQPAVIGRALRYVLTGRPVREVDFILRTDLQTAWKLVNEDRSAPHSVSSTFAQNAWQFDHEGCRYRAHVAQSKTVSEFLLDPDENRYSVDGFYSSNVNEVRGTQIAFWDLAHQRAVPVSKRLARDVYADNAVRRVWKIYQTQFDTSRQVVYLKDEGLEFPTPHLITRPDAELRAIAT